MGSSTTTSAFVGPQNQSSRTSRTKDGYWRLSRIYNSGRRTALFFAETIHLFLSNLHADSREERCETHVCRSAELFLPITSVPILRSHCSDRVTAWSRDGCRIECLLLRSDGARFFSRRTCRRWPEAIASLSGGSRDSLDRPQNVTSESVEEHCLRFACLSVLPWPSARLHAGGHLLMAGAVCEVRAAVTLASCARVLVSIARCFETSTAQSSSRFGEHCSRFWSYSGYLASVIAVYILEALSYKTYIGATTTTTTH